MNKPQRFHNSISAGRMRYDKILTTVVLLLFLLRFFSLKPFTNGLYNYFIFFLTLLLGFDRIKSNVPYAKLILYYLLSVLVSCLYSVFFNDQKLHICIFYSFDYFSIFFFFILVRLKLTAEESLKVLEYICICFCLCYILQWLIYPTVLFSCAGDTLNINDYVFRMRMPGSICCYLLCLFGINQYMLKRSPKYILYFLIGFLPIIIQGFRSLVTLTVLSIFLMIPFVMRKNLKTIVSFVLISLFLFIVFNTSNIFQDKYDEMLQRQKNEQVFSNEDYIRYFSLDYYWNYQFNKPYEKIIGGGVPVDRMSHYYKQITDAENYSNYFWVDLGIVGLSMVIGIPAVLLLVIMYLLCMWRCMEPQLQFVRFTLFTVLCGSIFTSMELYRSGNILLLSLLLYIEYVYHKDKTSFGHFNQSNYITKSPLKI